MIPNLDLLVKRLGEEQAKLDKLNARQGRCFDLIRACHYWQRASVKRLRRVEDRAQRDILRQSDRIAHMVEGAALALGEDNQYPAAWQRKKGLRDLAYYPNMTTYLAPNWFARDYADAGGPMLPDHPEIRPR